MTITIDHLANHPHLVRPIAEWCAAEWPWYYSNGDVEVAYAYHLRTAVTETIPCALVALDGDTLVGTIALLEEDMDVRPHLAPWLGCLFVDPNYRGRGVAAQLVKTGVRWAAEKKLSRLYAWTEKLSAQLRADGWSYLESPIYQGRAVDLFVIEPGALPSPQ